MKPRLLTAGLACLACLALLACSGPTEPAGDYVRIQTDRTSYALGETATVVLENQHPRYSIQFSGCLLSLERQNGDAWEATTLQACILVPSVVEARGTREWTLLLEPPQVPESGEYRYALEFWNPHTRTAREVTSEVFTVLE